MGQTALMMEHERNRAKHLADADGIGTIGENHARRQSEAGPAAPVRATRRTRAPVAAGNRAGFAPLFAAEKLRKGPTVSGRTRRGEQGRELRSPIAAAT